MSDYTQCINILLQSFKEMVKECDYKNYNSISHKRVKNFHHIISTILNIWHYELSYISKDEFNQIDQKICDIYNEYLTLINRMH